MSGTGGDAAGEKTAGEEVDPSSLGEVAVRTVAMPGDVNFSGNIFGGWLMAQLDTAAGMVGARHIVGRFVTAAVTGISFLRPVRVGEEVSIYGRVAKVGQRSVHFDIDVYCRTLGAPRLHKAVASTFVQVTVDGDGKPVPVRLRD